MPVAVAATVTTASEDWSSHERNRTVTAWAFWRVNTVTARRRTLTGRIDARVDVLSWTNVQ
jgi:hypothetical protein